MTATDADLVRDARSGNKAAGEELVRRTARLVFARLYLDLGDRHRADDLTQETYLRAMSALKSLDDPARFRPWLLSVAHRVLIDDARARSRLKRAGDVQPLVDAPSAGPTPDDAADVNERRAKVLAALRSLPDEYRLPLTLRYITGADYAAISEQLGLTNGSLRGLLHRGLNQLRERLPAEFAT